MYRSEKSAVSTSLFSQKIVLNCTASRQTIAARRIARRRMDDHRKISANIRKTGFSQDIGEHFICRIFSQTCGELRSISGRYEPLSQ